MKEAEELSHATDEYHAQPLEVSYELENIFTHESYYIYKQHWYTYTKVFSSKIMFFSNI